MGLQESSVFMTWFECIRSLTYALGIIAKAAFKYKTCSPWIFINMSFHSTKADESRKQDVFALLVQPITLNFNAWEGRDEF